MSQVALRSIGWIAAFGLASVAVSAVDPPDLRINALSGLIETVDATWSGSNYNVRYTAVNPTGQQTTSLLLSSNVADDLDPRIAISGAGNAYVAWWRDTAVDAVIYKKRSYATGAWSGERTVGLATEGGSRPRIIHAFDKTWVAYQIQNAKSRSIGCQIIDDDPEPFRSIVSTTSYSGDLDLQLSFEAGYLWVTWIDTSSRVGYAQYRFDRRAWSTVAYESFAGDSIQAARARIRDIVLPN